MKKGDYTTIAAHVPKQVAQAVREAAKAAGGQSVSEFLGGLAATAVSAQSAASVTADIASRAGGDEAGDGGVSAAAS